jgi:hypothetical protein
VQRRVLVTCGDPFEHGKRLESVMRLMPGVLAAFLHLLPTPASAAPFTTQSSSGGYGWADGQTRSFALTWDGREAVFAVDGIGSTSYASLQVCCLDLLERAGEIRPGGYFELTRIVINSIPLSTTIEDTLDLAMLRQTALYNVGRLTGDLTLRWASPTGPPPGENPYGNHVYASMMVLGVPSADLGLDAMSSSVADDDASTSVPEPATALLVGLGLLGAARLARRRLR